jgi:signal transduction histidine kinase
MTRVVALVGGVVLLLAAFFVTTTAWKEALWARRTLVSELSSAAGPARGFDVLGQQLRAEAGTAKPAQVLLDDTSRAVRTAEQRDALAELRRCASEAGGCGAPDGALARMHAVPLATVQTAWARADASETEARRRMSLGLGLLIGGVLVMLGVGLAPLFARSRPPSPTAVPADDQEIQQLLRERLEALYAARTQLGDGARFGAFGELAAALTHGLKTPLAGISAAVQLAQLKLGTASVAQSELEEVRALTDGLTEQLQRFLRAAGQVGPTRQRVEARQFVDLINASYTVDASGRGVTLTTATDQGRFLVEVDVPLLEMALRNLVENALVSGGRHVWVSAAPATAPARVGVDAVEPGPGPWLALTVEDDGSGLPSAARRAEAGVTTRSAGSGLGLAIARRVAERHGGALTLADREGGGTRISLVVPALPAGGGA